MSEERISAAQQLPHSVEAEQAVLGGLILANDSFDTVAAIIGEDDFFGHDHQTYHHLMHHVLYIPNVSFYFKWFDTAANS